MISATQESVSVPEIGKYHLVAELARGGMGNVYLAALQGPGGFQKLLVIKELKPDLCNDETYVAMFLEEARLAARLTHPNIVQTNEVGSEVDRHYMVMEFLDGRSLHRIGRRFAQQGGFPLGAHLRVIVEALRGLDYAHDLRGFDDEPLGVVHRDISPLNVVVTFDGQTKVLDFGIAKADDSSLETKAGILKGRVAYMAPEQACGARVDRRADVYSAGVMIWEAAAGRRLWAGMTDVEILSHVLREGAPLLRTLCPDASPELESICARAMARQADDRYPSAAALMEDLEAHVAMRDDKMSMREIGALLSRTFRDERQQTNAVIEETLLRVRGGTRSGVMPALKKTGPGRDARSLLADASGLSALLTHTPSGGAAVSPRDTSSQGGVVAGPERRRLLGARRALLGTAMGGALIAGLFAVSLSRKPPSPSSLAAAPRVNRPIAAEPAPEPAQVQVSVHVSPAIAQISIDGVLTARNPTKTQLPKDGKTHHVMAFADGYETKSEDVPSAGDVSLELSLERRPTTPPRWVPVVAPQARLPKYAQEPQRRAGPPDEPTPAPAANPAARTEFDPAGGHAPLRPIVTSNPYGAQ
jgi:serine/threonine protein kinase